MTFQLDVPTVLFAVGKALATQTLGAQRFRTCKYDYRANGHPEVQCAIGCALPQEVRDELYDSGRSFDRVQSLFELDIPAQQAADLQALQDAHDGWAHGQTTEQYFRLFFQNLCRKYAVPCGLPYYTLVTLESGRWTPQFGDYDRPVVAQERKDTYPRQPYKILRTLDDQPSVDAAILALNGAQA